MGARNHVDRGGQKTTQARVRAAGAGRRGRTNPAGRMSDVNGDSTRGGTWSHRWFVLPTLVPIAVLMVIVGLTSVATEPFFWNDETRHVMTGVFFSDFFSDGHWLSARDYAVRYYLQYPSLGLLVWPPLFHALEGAAMLAFGPSLGVAKALILAFAAMATAYLVALVARTHDAWTACLAGLLFVVSPMIVTYSRQVMLEMPALAFVLAATYHWVAYVDRARRAHLWLGAASACAAVLTRFDSAVLLPTLLLMVALRGDWQVLRRRQTWVAACASVVAVGPVVWLTATEFGAEHLSTIVPQQKAYGGLAAVAETVLFYVRSLPEQVGWVIPFGALAGAAQWRRTSLDWRRLTPYAATVVCTYVVFTAVAEKTPRHTIVWVPAFAALAAIGVAALRRGARASLPVWGAALVMLLATGVPALRARTPYVRGYARAAAYVVASTDASTFTLFDGYYDGNFTYQIRRLDPQRRLWVLRGDKLFYASVINVGQQYTEFVHSDGEMAELLASYDPELLVVESTPIGGRWTPAARRLRRLLAAHPERYRLEHRIPIETQSPGTDTVLLIYRSLVRNPAPRSSVELEMLTMRGRKFRTPDAPR